jgi:glycosyltransferase involved in cell wall biosynthesis
MPRDAGALSERALREAVAGAEDRFAAGDRTGALEALEAVRRAAPGGSRVWAEAMADIAVVLHSLDALHDAYAHVRHALRAEPGLEEARETAEVCATALGPGHGAPVTGDRILVVVDNFYPSRGGTEVLAEDLAVSLTRRGHPVEILCRAHPLRRPGWQGIPVHELEPASADRSLAALLAGGRFAAVIGISVPMGFPVLGILRLLHLLTGMRSLVVPCVNEEVDATVRASPDFLREYARLLFRVDAVGFSSQGGWDRALLTDLGVPGVYLPNAVPSVEQSGSLREELEVSRGTPIILHVANFWPQKNHLAFLAEMRATPGDWRLVCIGGPSADHPGLAREVAIAAARDPRVRLLGTATREEVAGAMLQSDLLVLPSIAEATPLVLLEAMSHGLPWIASDTCGSASELAGGTIVAQGGFAAEIERLLADAAERRSLGAAGRAAYAAGYSWDAVSPRYLAALGYEGDAPLRLAEAS